jgi:hypothetical protein
VPDYTEDDYANGHNCVIDNVSVYADPYYSSGDDVYESKR